MRRAHHWMWGMWLVSPLAGVVAGCSSDKAPVDAQVFDVRGPADVPVVPDVPLVPDAPPPDAAVPDVPLPDAGPTAVLGQFGSISLSEGFVFGEFTDHVTVVTVPEAPECVIMVRGPDGFDASAGTITVGGAVVGVPGGPTAPVVVEYSKCQAIYADGETFFPLDDTHTLDVSVSGDGHFPAMPAQTISPSPADPVTITAPADPDGAGLDQSSTAPLDLAWTVPTLHGSDEKLWLFIGFSAEYFQPTVTIYCAYPLADGHATLPAALLGEVAHLVGSTSTGYIGIGAGGSSTFTSGTATYVTEVGSSAAVMSTATVMTLESDLVATPPIDAGPSDVLILPDPTGPAPAGAVHCAVTIGGDDADFVSGVALAPDGTIVAVGGFAGTASFGGSPAVTLTSDSASLDAFIAHYDADCKPLWVRRAGGPGYDYANEVAVAGDGSIYLNGNYAMTATFAPGEAGAVSVTSAGNGDDFLAHYHADGSLDWVRSIGGVGDDYIYGLSLASDAVYLSGHFQETADFGNGVSLTVMPGIGAAFVARYTFAGAAVWARPGGDSVNGDVDFFDVAAAGSDVVVTGNWDGEVTFGMGEPGEVTYEKCDVDGFVLRYRADGTFAWSSIIGGDGFELPIAIAVDPADGSVLVTGYFGGDENPSTGIFGAGEANQASVPGVIEEAFVARYAGSDGHLIKVKAAGGPGGDIARDIAVTSQGYVVSGGYGGYNGPSYGVFGAGDANATTLVTQNGVDMFIASYQTAGALSWARGVASTDNFELAQSIAAGSDGTIVVGGSISAAATFDSTTLTPAGQDGFIVVYK